MSRRYNHLLSPIKIGNVMLKNRMISSNALPHFLQGPELFPNEQVITHLANLARGGAAAVTFAEWTNLNQRTEPIEDGKRFPMYDISDPSVHNYISQLVDQIHFYGSQAMISIRPVAPEGYGVCEKPGVRPTSQYTQSPLINKGPVKEMTEDMINELIENTAKMTKFYQDLGYDMCNIHMAYRVPILGHFISPIINKRTDKYGGSLENRARFPLRLCERIKEICGQDFPIEMVISAEEDGGTTLEESVEFAKMAEGKIDILQLRTGDGDSSHPTGFNSSKKYPQTLRYAEAIKASGTKILIEPIGGFQDLDLNEEFIATGKADLIGMGRAFICDPEYAKKAYEGRGEDVVPCIRCNKCHVPSLTGPWISLCSVNPKMGIAHKVDQMIEPVSQPKKVAVIGGGPAGMKAALVAAERGHSVTLYEKNYFLGGQLRHADFASFKWPLKNFKDYLIAQMDKAGIDVHLSTDATPEMIRSKGFDVVLLATGADFNTLNIPGADGSNVLKPDYVFGNEKMLGKNVVVVGGSQIGVEIGMYLAENGHKVTVLTRQKKLATDATPVHYVEMLRTAWEALDNFSFITEATTIGVTADKVIYKDSEGNEKSIQTDNVVLSSGLSSRHQDVMKFYETAEKFYVIGDCHALGNVQTSIRSAFAIASQI